MILISQHEFLHGNTHVKGLKIHCEWISASQNIRHAIIFLLTKLVSKAKMASFNEKKSKTRRYRRYPGFFEDPQKIILVKFLLVASPVGLLRGLVVCHELFRVI